MSLAARIIREFADRNLSPAALSAQLAQIARKARDDAIRAGEASSVYRRFVDGVEGVSEDSVRPDGRIRYLFSTIGEAAMFGLQDARRRSPPDDTGDYRRAWMIAVNGLPYTGLMDEIPANAEVTIVNSLPYHRMIEMGLRDGPKTSREITEKVRNAIRVRYPNLEIERVFVKLTPAFRFGSYETPYRLKGRVRRVEAKQNRRSRVFRAGGHYLKQSARTARGVEINYPAIVLSAR